LLAVSDAIMVARGDLGVDIPVQRVPLVQKEIIRKSNKAGRPVITATQMLESMVNSAWPTRAEVTDVANAIFDGTDAIMLSGETAVGKYPLLAVRMMDKIARETERQLPYESILQQRVTWLRPEMDEVISYEACHTAHEVGATAIIAFTKSGITAQRVSRFRPREPVLALTPDTDVLGRLILCWGVYPIKTGQPSSVDELFALGARLATELGVAKSGDLIVITGGIPIGVSGATNLLKVEKIE
jgi:pyruvate kinase